MMLSLPYRVHARVHRFQLEISFSNPPSMAHIMDTGTLGLSGWRVKIRISPDKALGTLTLGVR